MPFLALTVQVDPLSAVIWPMSPWAWPLLAGAVAAGGAVVVGVIPGVVDPPEQAATTPTAAEAPITPIATFIPIRR
ncbi:MAG TPA: hypothetical protein VFW21_01925 [Mycobacterium sp.]|nr:hypothetical protein [Mycobacterium sp.]